MRILLTLAVLIILAVIAAAVYFRAVPMPAETWHVDPSDAIAPASPNYELRQGATAPVIPAPMPDVAARLDAVAEAEGARVIAGAAIDGFVTYIARSARMGFPDAVSVRLSPEGDGTRMEIFSRSRFGYSDMGVNAARVARWIDAVTP
jgi:uncharacterized protein (DUF1499 family)